LTTDWYNALVEHVVINKSLGDAVQWKPRPRGTPNDRNRADALWSRVDAGSLQEHAVNAHSNGLVGTSCRLAGGYLVQAAGHPMSENVTQERYQVRGMVMGAWRKETLDETAAKKYGVMSW